MKQLVTLLILAALSAPALAEQPEENNPPIPTVLARRGKLILDWR